MAIEEISAEQVIAESRALLGLPPGDSNGADEAMLAASLRRAAGICCPCSRSTLVNAVIDAFQFLTADSAILAERLDETVERLVAVGDLLELDSVATDDTDAKGTWVFPAPPSFVVRPSGNIFILGIVPEEASSLPAFLNARVAHEGCTRVLIPEPSEDLPSTLRGYGLLRISDAAWLKMPKPEPAANLCESMMRRLSALGTSGDIAEISILDPSQPVTYYNGRWRTPNNDTGVFVARRPQAYGAALWGLVRLEQGRAKQFLDFPIKGTRWRGSDTAWHLQMAIDHDKGAPQRYRRSQGSTGTRFDFFSPLPLWAQRRLTLTGRPVLREKCLLSFVVPDHTATDEEAFLKERLWLTKID
jgi:hypothetical protein